MQTDTYNNCNNGAFAANRNFKLGFRKQFREGADRANFKGKSAGSVRGSHVECHRERQSSSAIADCSDNKKDFSNIVCFKCKKNGYFMSKCPDTNRFEGGLSAVFTTGDFKDTDWYVDSGVSMYLTASKQWLKDQRNPDLPEIVVANKSKIKVECAGNVEMNTVTDRAHKILLKEVQYVPGLTTNLLSVCQLIRNGNKVFS
ncbi:uncharacterized protein LOC130450038 [Diorhabda sublineata]|uniref:uncharacterized protein LOC130450038 n=1 Tax=Diorhabda sublineata TaxID=1163346 RepID=UPI0024E18BCB|nr:uncharacterized protein LOC130450038 [Diorhabda sublineata]